MFRVQKKLPLILSLVWLILILLLGSWWMFLLIKLSNQLISYNAVQSFNYLKIVKYEGISFFILLILVSLTLFYFYYQEIKQANSLKAFFASLTHELKTPLASMKLQTEVIKDLVDRGNTQNLKNFSEKLISDSKRLELELDKILHLAKIERGVSLPLQEIDLNRFVKKMIQKYQAELEIEYNDQKEPTIILADEFALTLIFRNLMDNSLKHSQTKKIKINIDHHNLTYSDETTFTGDLKKLGTLFYKHNSPKGSGIGIYLIKKLSESMKGKFEVQNNVDRLNFCIHFQEAKK